MLASLDQTISKGILTAPGTSDFFPRGVFYCNAPHFIRVEYHISRHHPWKRTRKRRDDAHGRRRAEPAGGAENFS